jgi:hypothetical protein
VGAIAQLGAAFKVVAALATKGKCGSIDCMKRGRLVVAVPDRPDAATDGCVNVKRRCDEARNGLDGNDGAVLELH